MENLQRSGKKQHQHRSGDGFGRHGVIAFIGGNHHRGGDDDGPHQVGAPAEAAQQEVVKGQPDVFSLNDRNSEEKNAHREENDGVKLILGLLGLFCVFPAALPPAGGGAFAGGGSFLCCHMYILCLCISFLLSGYSFPPGGAGSSFSNSLQSHWVSSTMEKPETVLSL